MSGAFVARYPGRCGAGDDPIRPGELVRFVDDELVHDACEHSDPARPAVVCASCWLTKPCDCDETPRGLR